MFAAAAAGTAALAAGFLVKTTAVLVLALVAAAVSRRKPAAFRHFVLSAALVGLLLLPVLTFAPIGWRSELVPAWMGPAAPPPASPADATTGAEIPGLLGKVRMEWTPAARSAELPGRRPVEIVKGEPLGSTVANTRTASPLPAAFTETGAAKTDALKSKSTLLRPDAGSTASAAGPGSGVLGPVLAVLWAAGLAVLIIRLFVGLAGAVRLTAEGTPLRDPAWRALLDRFLALVSLRRTVQLRSHPQVLVPLTWGWRKPVVLLPDGADGWTEDERSSALFHELSHIKRADFLVMLLVRASLALFWWNPLCWIVYRELLKEQEIACDELVLRAGIRPSTYAASLLAFRRAAGFRWNPSAALLGMLGRSSFQDRVAAILRQKLTFMEVRMKTKIMVALVLVLAVAFVGSARPLAGREAAGASAVFIPAEAAAEGAIDIAPAAAVPGPQTQAEKAVQEKKAQEAKAADKAKQAEKAKPAEKTVIVKPIVVEGKPIEIVITVGDVVKTLKADKSLTITTEKEGGAIVLKIDGEEPRVLKGEPLRLEIKGGELAVLREGVPLKIVEGKPHAEAHEIVTKDGVIYVKPRAEGGRAFTLAKTAEGGEIKIVEGTAGEAKTIVFVGEGEPKVAVEKIRIAEGETVPEVIVKQRHDIKPGETWVSAVPKEKAQTGEVAIVTEGKPMTMTWTAKPAMGRALALATDRQMLEKVRALQEQVQAIKAKKMDITALEESLKKLEQELQVQEETIKELEHKLAKEPMVVYKKAGEAEAGTWSLVRTEGKEEKAAAAKVMVSSSEKDANAIHMIFTGHKGAEGQTAVERAVAALKKALPEGYTIAEQKFDEDSGAITFKVKGPAGQKTDEGLIKKLVDAVKDALKK